MKISKKDKKRIKKRIVEVERRIAEIDAEWDRRNVTDATSEPEWNECENLLGVLYQLTHLDFLENCLARCGYY